MKVLLILDNLSLSSGVSSIVMDLYRNITGIEFDFLLFRNEASQYTEEIKNSRGRIYILEKILSPKTFFKANAQAKTFFKEHAGEYDAVHLHSPTLNEFTLKYAKKYGIKKRIIHSHSSMTSTSFIKSKVNALLLRNVKKYATDFWTCSNAATQFLYGDAFARTNKVELIRNAVEPKKYLFNGKIREQVREKFDIQDKTVFVHISNFSPIKNHIFLVSVIAEVTRKDPSAVFLFVGDGPAKGEFEAALKTNGLIKSCLFVGNSDNVTQYLSASDALLLPSLKEGLPLTVIEAQANGVPCFVSSTVTHECNVGGVTYIDLDQTAWIKAICEFTPLKETERKENSKKFALTDFNIKNEALRVEKLYFETEK